MGDGQGVAEEDGEEAEEHQSVDAAEDVLRGAVDPYVAGYEEEHQGGEDAEGHFFRYGASGDVQRNDGGCHAKDQEDVENVRPDHVAHGQVGAALEGGEYAHGQLRGGGAEGYDRESDHEV